MFEDLMALCLAGNRLALPQDWWQAFSLAPATLVPLLALLAWLLASHRRAVALAGWGLLVLALLSPLCRLAATLAAAHMAQLMVLLVGMALLALGTPARHRMPGPGPAALVHGALLWLWHFPPVYAAALQSPWWHVLAMALLLASAWWFWRAVLLAPASQRGAACLALLATMAHTGLLGALLTFASQPLYPVQEAGARAWGLEPLQDQQLAGLLMWVLGALGYLLTAVALALRWLGADQQLLATAGPGQPPHTPASVRPPTPRPGRLGPRPLTARRPGAAAPH